MAGPHFDEINTVTAARVAKVKTDAVTERLHSEIRYWDRRSIRDQSPGDRRPQAPPQLQPGAQARAEDLAARLARNADWNSNWNLTLHNNSTHGGRSRGGRAPGTAQRDSQTNQHNPGDASVRAETDRRAVAAVLKAERALGRVPEDHSTTPTPATTCSQRTLPPTSATS